MTVISCSDISDHNLKDAYSSQMKCLKVQNFYLLWLHVRRSGFPAGFGLGLGKLSTAILTKRDVTEFPTQLLLYTSTFTE